MVVCFWCVFFCFEVFYGVSFYIGLWVNFRGQVRCWHLGCYIIYIVPVFFFSLLLGTFSCFQCFFFWFCLSFVAFATGDLDGISMVFFVLG